MISKAYDTISEWSVTGWGSGAYFRNLSTNPDRGGWKEALTARALFIAQAVNSLVLAPLLFVGGLFASGFALCTEGKETAYELLKIAVAMVPLHLSLFGASLIAAILPHSFKWETPYRQSSIILRHCCGDL